MFDLTPYALAIFVHVLAAVALTGHALSAPLHHRLIREAATTGDLLRWMDLLRLEARFNPAVALVLLATGVYLGSFGWWTAPWFYVAVGAWFASFAIAKGVIQPSAMRLATAAAQAGPGAVPPAIDALRRSRAWTMASATMLGIDVALLLVMFNKPSLGVSLAWLAAAIGASCGLRMLGDRSPATRASRRHVPAHDIARG